MTFREATAVSTTPARWPHRRFRPSADAPPRGRVGLPAGLLGMLALVAAVEAGIAGAGGRFINSINYSLFLSARAASTKAPACDILCLGDSLVKHGLSPRVFKEVTGRQAYNLAVPASPVPISDVLFRRALDAGAKPRAVVFDMKPSLVIGGPEFSARHFAEVMTPGEKLDLCLQQRSVSFATDLMLKSLISSYRCRHEIRYDLMAALQGMTADTRAVNAVNSRNWTVNDGANVAAPRPGYTGAVTEAEHWHLISRGFFPNRINDAYACRLVALAEERGAAAYLLLPPFVPDLGERRSQTGAETKYLKFVRSLQDRFPQLTVLDARESGYPGSAFIDPIHLDSRGAVALSNDVAAVLRDDLDRPGEPRPPKRWARLPQYRERPLPADLEDVELSRARVNQGLVR